MQSACDVHESGDFSKDAFEGCARYSDSAHATEEIHSFVWRPERCWVHIMKWCQFRSKTVSPGLMQIPFPRPFHRNSFQNCFTRDNAGYVPRPSHWNWSRLRSQTAPKWLPRSSLPWTFSDERLNWHDIHDSVLTWCPGAGSISWRQGEGPKGVGVADSAIFHFEKQTFNRFLPAKRFTNFIFSPNRFTCGVLS